MDIEGRRFAALFKEIRQHPTLNQGSPTRQLGVSCVTAKPREIGNSKPSNLAKSQLESFWNKVMEQGSFALSETDGR